MTTSIDHTETPSSSNTPPDMADLRSLLDLPDTLFRFLVCHDAGPVHRVAVRNADHEVETIGTLSEDGQVEVGRVYREIQAVAPPDREQGWNRMAGVIKAFRKVFGDEYSDEAIFALMHLPKSGEYDVIRHHVAATNDELDDVAGVARWAFGKALGGLNRSLAGELTPFVTHQTPSLWMTWDPVVQPAQVIMAHTWFSTVFSTQALDLGRGILPFDPAGGDFDVAWSALDVIAEREGVTVLRARAMVSMAPYVLVKHFGDEDTSQIMLDIIFEIQKSGRGYGYAPFVWHSLWEILQANAGGGEALEENELTRLESMLSAGVPTAAQLFQAFPGIPMSAVLRAMGDLANKYDCLHLPDDHYRTGGRTEVQEAAEEVENNVAAPMDAEDRDTGEGTQANKEDVEGDST